MTKHDYWTAGCGVDRVAAAGGETGRECDAVGLGLEMKLYSVR